MVETSAMADSLLPHRAIPGNLAKSLPKGVAHVLCQ